MVDLIAIANDVIPNYDLSLCLKTLLENDFDNQKHNYVWLAYNNKKIELFKYLVDRGASIIEKNDFDSEPLASTIEANDFNLYKYAVDKAKDINKFDKENNYNLLLSACFTGNYDKVSYLIEKGVDINVSNYQNVTAFYDACKGGNVDIVKLLIHNNVMNLYKSNDFGMSPIFVALAHKKYNVVKYLLEIGYDLHKVSDLYEFLFFISVIGNFELANLVGDYYLDLHKVSYYETVSMKDITEGYPFAHKPDFMEETYELSRRGLLRDEIFQAIAKYHLWQIDFYAGPHPEKKLLNIKGVSVEADEEVDEELVDVITVKYFKNANKTYTFLSNGIQCNPGDQVLVNTNGQDQNVIVATGNKKVYRSNYAFALKSIIKKT